MDANTASGMAFEKIVVIVRNRELQASKNSFSTAAYSPIIPAATPQITARKMIWRVSDSRNGARKLEGTMLTIVERSEVSTPVSTEMAACPRPPASAKPKLPG